MKKRITEEECKALYKKYNTPAHVIRHCYAVSETAVKIGEALNKKGKNFDLDLVKGAGLAHDIERVHENHGERCAKILRGLGYYDEADIVEVHMHHTFSKFNNMTEVDLVCLGDRLVREDQYVGIDDRIDYLIHKTGENPIRTKRLLIAKKKSKEFISEIDNYIGCSIDSLFMKG